MNWGKLTSFPLSAPYWGRGGQKDWSKGLHSRIHQSPNRTRHWFFNTDFFRAYPIIGQHRQAAECGMETKITCDWDEPIHQVTQRGWGAISCKNTFHFYFILFYTHSFISLFSYHIGYQRNFKLRHAARDSDPNKSPSFTVYCIEELQRLL